MILGGFEGKIPGASIIDFAAAKGAFVLRKAVPGVIFVLGSGDTPEVEGFSAVFLSVEYHLHK